MKEITISYFLCFYLFSCSANNDVEEKDNNAIFIIEKVKENDFLSAKKSSIEKLYQDTSKVYQKNKQITLPLNLGSHKIFRDSILNGENIEKYEFIGEYKDIDMYLIFGIYWENSEGILVDKNNGEIYRIWNKPTISPDNKKLASICSYGMEGMPIGIQIMNIGSQKEYTRLNNFIEVNQRIWNPLDFVWESNNSLILKVNYNILVDTTDESSMKKVEYIRIRFNE